MRVSSFSNSCLPVSWQESWLSSFQMLFSIISVLKAVFQRLNCSSVTLSSTEHRIRSVRPEYMISSCSSSLLFESESGGGWSFWSP